MTSPYQKAKNKIKKAEKEDSVKLNLSDMSLEKVPSEIAELDSLQELWLDNNELTEIPPEIGELDSLQELNLSDNELTEIPPEIGELDNLEVLGLALNELSEIPPEIGELDSLQGLYLRWNELTEIPPEIGELSELKKLYLKNNKLTELPIALAKLKNLEELILQDNPLEYPPQDVIDEGVNAVIEFLEDELKKEGKEVAIYTTKEEIRERIGGLKDEENMLDVREIEIALKDDEIERAGKLLEDLEENYQEYKNTIQRLEEIDGKLADLSEKLASGEIDSEDFKDAKESLKNRKYDLEEKLNSLRKEVIYEDYEKPFPPESEE